MLDNVYFALLLAMFTVVINRFFNVVEQWKNGDKRKDGTSFVFAISIVMFIIVFYLIMKL